MNRAFSLSSFLFVALLGLVGCNSTQPTLRLSTPSANEPRAIVRFSQEVSGKLDNQMLESKMFLGEVEVSGSDYPIHPRPSQVSYAGSFFHEESHWEVHRVTEYTNEYESCVSRDRKGDCVSGYVSKSRSVDRDVLVTTRVDDGSCNASAKYAFEPSATYDVHFSQTGPTACSVQCTREGGAPCELLAQDATLPAPVTEHYVASPVHYAGYPIAAAGITSIVVGLGVVLINAPDRNVTEEHCQADKCDSIGDAERKRAQAAQLPGAVMLLGGLGATAGGLLMINVSGRWEKNHVSVGTTGNQVVLGGVF